MGFIHFLKTRSPCLCYCAMASATTTNAPAFATTSACPPPSLSPASFLLQDAVLSISEQVSLGLRILVPPPFKEWHEPVLRPVQALHRGERPPARRTWHVGALGGEAGGIVVKARVAGPIAMLRGVAMEGPRRGGPLG